MDNITFEKWYKFNKGKYVNIVLGGKVFGGRYGESPQCVKYFRYIDEKNLKIMFATTEVLEIINPINIEMGDFNQLIIKSADRAQFGWHYYGRPQIPENWCTIIYKLNKGKVHFKQTGPVGMEECTYELKDEPFIKLI